MLTSGPDRITNKVGFISTRFAGTDGVSLESAKWAQVLWESDGKISHWYSGRSDRDPHISMCVPEAHFGHPENQWINARIWGVTHRDPFVSKRIREYAVYLKKTLYDFVERFDIELLIPQNALTIPMHVPLGIALTEFLAETNMPAIAHHHDFYWERTRFSVNAVSDYLDMAFPPRLRNLHHVVINQAAQEQLSLRKGVGSVLIPNLLDFENPPPPADEYVKDLKADLGFEPDDVIILQPTRIVPRKGIEHAIKLVGALKDPRCKLVISHEGGDEGHSYQHMLMEMAHEEGVDLRLVADRIGEERHLNDGGQKIYTLWDLYRFADLVTYPSIYEGFGNALLEAIYFGVPIVVNRYSIFIEDIEPKGFRLPVIDGFVTSSVVSEIRRLLLDERYRTELSQHNYEIARRFYSYRVLRRQLRAMIASVTGVD